MALINKHTRNLTAVCCIFFLDSLSYSSLQALQSSLNSSEGLGLGGLTSVYVAMTISCLFLSPIWVRKLGVKNTMVVASVAYGVFAASNIYPRFYTIIPAAVFCGLSSGPNWVVASVHLSTLAFNKAKTANQHEVLSSRYLGLHIAAFQAGFVLSNLITSQVLSMGDVSDEDKELSYNFSLSQCGARDCGAEFPEKSVGDAIKPPQYLVRILLGFFAACSIIISPIIGVRYLDNLKPNTNFPGAVKISSGLDQGDWSSTLRTFKEVHLLMLVPFELFVGMYYAFVMGDFTKSFVSCAQGIDSVGYVITLLAAVAACSSVFFSWLRKYAGRLVVFSSAAALTLGVLVASLVWDPVHYETWHLFLMAAAWGTVDGVWQMQIRVLAGVLLPNRQGSAFAAYYFISSIGYVTSFAMSIPKGICVSYKIYQLIALVSVAMMLYYAVELSIYLQFKKTRRCGTGEMERDLNEEEKTMMNEISFTNKNVQA